MQQIDKLKGAEATVQNKLKRFSTAAVLVIIAAFLAACGGPPAVNGGGSTTGNETAATVNGTVITMQEVDRAVKQQAQGQEAKMSPLELAAARLQVLQTLLEQEVMYQKAVKEETVPKDDEVTAEVNKQKVESRMSAEEFDKQMSQAGLDEAAFRLTIKKGLAIKKLIEKITGRIEPPKDKEIVDLFAGNPEAFVKKRGVRLAAIVVDPSNSGEGDVTTNAAEANVKINEVLTKLRMPSSDFAALAREYSEDGSKLQGGDLGYITEQDLKSNFGEQIAAQFMDPQKIAVGGITNAIPLNGKAYIFKLQERIEKEETQTLETPGVRQQITDMLVNNRKQLLAASYQAIAMNEAKIENILARKVVDNPNELSGARMAGSATPAANKPAAPANSNAPAANANVAANAKPAANGPAKPAAKAPAKPAPANK